MLDAARKQTILANREAALRRALAKKLPERKVIEAAEAVRCAKLALFKAQRVIAQQIEEPSTSEKNHLARLQESEWYWQGRAVEQILTDYVQVEDWLPTTR